MLVPQDLSAKLLIWRKCAIFMAQSVLSLSIFDKKSKKQIVWSIFCPVDNLTNTISQCPMFNGYNVRGETDNLSNRLAFVPRNLSESAVLTDQF